MNNYNIKNYFSSLSNSLNESQEQIEDSSVISHKSKKNCKKAKESGYKSKDETIKQNMEEVLRTVEKKKKCLKKRRMKKIREQTDMDPEEISEILGKVVHFSPTKPRKLLDSEDEENEQKIANLEDSEPFCDITSFEDSKQIALEIEEVAERIETEKPKNAFHLMMQSRPAAKINPVVEIDCLPVETNPIKSSKRIKIGKRFNTSNNKIEILELEKKSETANLLLEVEIDITPRRRGRHKNSQLTDKEDNNNVQVIESGKEYNETIQQEINDIPLVSVIETKDDVLLKDNNLDVVKFNNKRKISTAGGLVPKKRKTKEVKEKLLETPPKTANLDDSAIWQSGRPRRTCTAKIPTWEELLTPEKDEVKVVRKKKNTQADYIEIDDSSPEKMRTGSVKVKLAPLFVKQLPKPCIDPLVLAARKNFLLSGIPEVLKVEIDKLKKFEDEFLGNELVAYPLLAHVNKFEEKLPEVSMKTSKVKLTAILEDEDCNLTISLKPLKYGSLTSCNMQEVNQILKQKNISYVPANKFKDVKKILQNLKIEYDTFPVYRSYKQIKAKKNSEGLMVERFKPSTFNEYLFNFKPVKELQSFLTLWNNNERRLDSCDESNSNSSHKNKNCIVIYGPLGTGKTSSVFALSSDLNFKVIEINAGSKRTGKKMLQELQEATQSHRIKKVQDDDDNEENQKTVILIEDADVVFDDLDDGFVSSLQTLVNMSKRPVILTALNGNCPHLQKFQQGNSVFYNRATCKNMAIYLQNLCLVENNLTTLDQIEQLLQMNNYDLRKTINELEFFVKSNNSKIVQGDLMEFYGGERRTVLKRSWENFELLEAELAIAKLTRRNNEDRLTDCLEEKIAEFLSKNSFMDDRKVLKKSALSNSLVSSNQNLIITSLALLDYESMLRQICRTEKKRLENERKGSRFYHYLRNLVIMKSFSSNFFDEYCESLQ